MIIILPTIEVNLHSKFCSEIWHNGNWVIPLRLVQNGNSFSLICSKYNWITLEFSGKKEKEETQIYQLFVKWFRLCHSGRIHLSFISAFFGNVLVMSSFLTNCATVFFRKKQTWNTRYFYNMLHLKERNLMGYDFVLLGET